MADLIFDEIYRPALVPAATAQAIRDTLEDLADEGQRPLRVFTDNGGNGHELRTAEVNGRTLVYDLAANWPALLIGELRAGRDGSGKGPIEALVDDYAEEARLSDRPLCRAVVMSDVVVPAEDSEEDYELGTSASGQTALALR